MGALNDWDVTDANNNAAPPDGWPENTMNYSDVNNTGRAVQGTMKRYFADINGSLDAGGAADAYTLTLNETGYVAYFDGMIFACSIPVTNLTTTPTMDVNGIGPVTIVDHNGNAISAGELSAGGIHEFRHDGTNLRIVGTGGVAGLDTEFQFNNAGIFGGASGLTYNSGTDEITVANPANFSSDLVLTEQGDHASTPGTGFGYIWVRASDNLLIYTDEAGIDTSLSGGASIPGGSNSMVQYNNAGGFGGDAAFTFNDATGIAGITGIQATTFYNSDSRTSADGLAVSRWFSPFGSTIGTVFARNIELNGTTLERGRTGDGVCAIYFDTDVQDGVMTLGVEPDGIAAGTTVSFTAQIVLDANNFGENIQFHVDNDAAVLSEIARITNDGFIFANGLTEPVGVRFPSTANPSANANTFDDYREGTFTPTLQDASLSDAEGQTYAVQTGSYTKIGNRVFFELFLNVTSIGTLTGGQGAIIANLPFTAAGTVTYGAVGINASGLTIAAGNNVTGQIAAGNDYMTLEIWDAANGTTAMTITEFGVAFIRMVGHYATDE